MKVDMFYLLLKDEEEIIQFVLKNPHVPVALVDKYRDHKCKWMHIPALFHSVYHLNNCYLKDDAKGVCKYYIMFFNALLYTFIRLRLFVEYDLRYQELKSCCLKLILTIVLIPLILLSFVLMCLACCVHEDENETRMFDLDEGRELIDIPFSLERKSELIERTYTGNKSNSTTTMMM